MEALHSLGWVHRDISTGNILVVDGMAKIVDLELAKRIDDDPVHDVPTLAVSFYLRFHLIVLR